LNNSGKKDDIIWKGEISPVILEELRDLGPPYLNMLIILIIIIIFIPYYSAKTSVLIIKSQPLIELFIPLYICIVILSFLGPFILFYYMISVIGRKLFAFLHYGGVSGSVKYIITSNKIEQLSLKNREIFEIALSDVVEVRFWLENLREYTVGHIFFYRKHNLKSSDGKHLKKKKIVSSVRFNFVEDFVEVLEILKRLLPEKSRILFTKKQRYE